MTDGIAVGSLVADVAEEETAAKSHYSSGCRWRSRMKSHLLPWLFRCREHSLSVWRFGERKRPADRKRRRHSATTAIVAEMSINGDFLRSVEVRPDERDEDTGANCNSEDDEDCTTSSLWTKSSLPAGFIVGMLDKCPSCSKKDKCERAKYASLFLKFLLHTFLFNRSAFNYVSIIRECKSDNDPNVVLLLSLIRPNTAASEPAESEANILVRQIDTKIYVQTAREIEPDERLTSDRFISLDEEDEQNMAVEEGLRINEDHCLSGCEPNYDDELTSHEGSVAGRHQPPSQKQPPPPRQQEQPQDDDSLPSQLRLLSASTDGQEDDNEDEEEEEEEDAERTAATTPEDGLFSKLSAPRTESESARSVTPTGTSSSSNYVHRCPVCAKTFSSAR
ncbi:hypothetical protein AAVH_11667 [Aphelenchoides avenae]|nr:hypothetical protein AAVH_11667 [Aphelenchus avenae]